MSPGNNLLVDSAIILSLLLVGVVGYKLSPLLMPRADMVGEPYPACDLHRAPCMAKLPGGGRLELSITPRPVPVATPIEIAVEITGRSAGSVEVDFSGVSMNMGFNRPVLTATATGRYTAQTSLPVCVTGRMTWQATVLIEAESARIAVPFRFDVGG